MYNLGVLEQDAILKNITDTLDRLEHVHSVVLFGSERDSIEGILSRPSVKHDPRLDLFYSDGCAGFVDPTGGELEDCSTVSNGVMAQGLSAGVLARPLDSSTYIHTYIHTSIH
jgi:hypothetical protein